jgi:hypothetical protein
MLRDVSVVRVDPTPTWVAARHAAYEEMFGAIDDSHLLEADAWSEHFAFIVAGTVVGGIRRTPIGASRSEVERIFSRCAFAAGSFEVGRFWLAREHRPAYTARAALAAFLDAFPDEAYAKTRAALARLVVHVGGVRTGLRGYNDRLQYNCELIHFPARRMAGCTDRRLEVAEQDTTSDWSAAVA